VRGFSCPFRPIGDQTAVKEKTEIAAKDRKERKEKERRKFNRWAATAKTRVATKII
jgi:hypothetical protein